MPILVLIHGYGGSSLVFYKCVKALAKSAHVYLLDIPGIGKSSRQPMDAKGDFEESKNYYVQAIEIWREKLGLTDITLGCHSFGALISAHYARAHPKHIRKLILLSPYGFLNQPVVSGFEMNTRNKTCGNLRWCCFRSTYWCAIRKCECTNL